MNMTAGTSSLHGPRGPVTLAVAVRYDHSPRRLEWIEENGFACAFTPDPDALDRIGETLGPYMARGMAVRHHGYFPGLEIGHPDPRIARRALDFHLKVIDAIDGIGEPHLTVHVGLDFAVALNPERVVENLGRIVARGARRGITVSLENLRQGPTADPDILCRWADATGAAVTFDIGHAVSCPGVRCEDLSVGAIIDRLDPKITEVHCYEYESDHHHAPHDLRVLGPIVDRLAAVDCPGGPSN